MYAEGAKIDVEKTLLGIGYDGDGQLFGAVGQYQQHYGLTVDGDAGPITTSHIAGRFCGLPDFMDRDPDQAKWPDSCKEKTFAYVFDQIQGVNSATVVRAVSEVLIKLNKMSGAKLELVQSLNTAEIWATDGPLNGSTLAWSFLPNGSCQDRIEQRYDTSNRNWNFDLLAKVLLHELGHAFGLEHSNQRADIMYPSVDNTPWSSYPSANDIARMVAYYGPNEAPEPDPPTPDPGKPATDLALKLGNAIDEFLAEPTGNGGNNGGTFGL